MGVDSRTVNGIGWGVQVLSSAGWLWFGDTYQVKAIADSVCADCVAEFDEHEFRVYEVLA